MAEQEVIKHTKKIYRIWNNKQHSLWHKVKEFLLEIFIIVFAVSLSMWLHNRSEHAHQQADVKAFMTGLKKDLTADMAEMHGDRKSIVQQTNAFKYLSGIKMGQKVDPDSLKLHFIKVLSMTGLQPNSGRYEGFRSSGKIGYIENAELQNDIMDLYQENIPALINNTTSYKNRKEKIQDFMQRNYKRTTDSTNNLIDIFSMEEAHTIFSMLVSTQDITSAYDSTIKKMQQIIKKIDDEYDLKDK